MEPRLYIIMREDLWDMNPGKGMAQAAHAQADFDAYQSSLVNQDGDEFWQAMSAWREDREFGVTLVLTAPKSEWMQISLGVEHCGYVNDPTYPYRNYYGKLFTSSEDTCMWVFATTEQEVEHMNQWPLQK
jgi:hypothetical protein